MCDQSYIINFVQNKKGTETGGIGGVNRIDLWWHVFPLFDVTLICVDTSFNMYFCVLSNSKIS